MVQTYFFTLFRTCDKIIIIILASISVFVTHCVNACCATNVRVLRHVYICKILSLHCPHKVTLMILICKGKVIYGYIWSHFTFFNPAFPFSSIFCISFSKCITHHHSKRQKIPHDLVFLHCLRQIFPSVVVKSLLCVFVACRSSRRKS